MNRESACLLCGDINPDVRMALVEWRNPIANRRYEAIPRCADHEACRGRVLFNGEEWVVGLEKSA